MMHFGGGKDLTTQEDFSMYGPTGNDAPNLSQVYLNRRSELDDYIMRRKVLKAEKQKTKEDQVETIDTLDQDFANISALLDFRDKEQEIRDHIAKQREGKLAPDEQEFLDWDREMKKYQLVDKKVQAVDRTKTPEEIAQEEADRLHQLETRRLARMNNDFDNDDLSDVSIDDRKFRKKRKRADHPESLQNDSDGEDEDTLQTRFTADGPVLVDKNGVIIKRLQPSTAEALAVGTRVAACYHASDQYDTDDSEKEWYHGVVTQSQTDMTTGEITYSVDYDDGDFEDGIEARYVRPLDEGDDDMNKRTVTAATDAARPDEEAKLKAKRIKARERAR
jgi:nucleolar protein 14